MARRSGKNRNYSLPGGSTKNFWQTSQRGQSLEIMYRDWIQTLAMSRYRWENLPATCDQKYLERILCWQGSATLAECELGLVSLPATGGLPGIYGDPTSWRAIADNGFNVECTPANAVIVWDNTLKTCYMNNVLTWAGKLASLDIAIDLNVKQQLVPWIFKCPQERVYDVTNILKQAMGGEPAVIGFNGIENIKSEALATQPQLIVESLQIEKDNIWREIYTFFGINNVTEKSERMIESEVTSKEDPATMMLLDGLNMRRQACEYINDLLGYDIKVYKNSDIETNNFIINSDLTKRLELGGEA